MFDVAVLRIRGPLAGLEVDLAGVLRDRGYRDNTVGWLVRLFARFSGWLESEGLDVSSLGRSEIGRFVADCRKAGRRHPASIKGMAPIVGFLADAGLVLADRLEGDALEPPGSPAVVVAEFAEYLSTVRGLAAATVTCYAGPAMAFLECHAPDGVVCWEHVRGESVQVFLQGWSAGRSTGAVALAATALRALLRWAFLRDRVDTDLSGRVGPVAARRGLALVEGLDESRVAALVASISTDARIGARDKAVVVVLARLGLRAGEAARLCLDDIDWGMGTVTVRGKGARDRVVPIPVDVGQAIVTYLRLRPADPRQRSVFLREKAPPGPLTAGGITGIVADRAKTAGLGTVHAHKLRHSAAMAVIAHGGSLTEAGQLLGHALASTTAIYAKTDAASLRRLALEWPGGER
jgi:integrase/recombinase XerD